MKTRKLETSVVLSFVCVHCSQGTIFLESINKFTVLVCCGYFLTFPCASRRSPGNNIHSSLVVGG